MGQCVAKGRGSRYGGGMEGEEVTAKENSPSTSGFSSKRRGNSFLSKRWKSTKSSVRDASTPGRGSETHSPKKVVIEVDNKVDKDAKQWDDEKRADDEVAGNVNDNEGTKTTADANKKPATAPITVPLDGEEGKVRKSSVKEAASPAGMVEDDAQKSDLTVDDGGVREKSGQQGTDDESAEERSAKGEEVVEKAKGQECALEALSPILEKERILNDESLKQQPAPAVAEQMESVTNIKGACMQKTHITTESTDTESDSGRLTAKDNAEQLYKEPVQRGDSEKVDAKVPGKEREDAKVPGKEREDAKVRDEDRLREGGAAAILNTAMDRCNDSATALDLLKNDSAEVMGSAQIGSDDHMSTVDENGKANDLDDDDDVVAGLAASSKGPQTVDTARGDEDWDSIRESPSRAVTLMHQGSIALTHDEMEALFGHLQSAQ